jgi:hypothetical protein
MRRAEAERLLGGYATGTLTEAERKALFAAALAGQELFDTLADEEALRELLSDPLVRRRLLDALAGPTASLFERVLAWWRRPVAWGVAGSVAVAVLLVVVLVPIYRPVAKPPAVQMVAQAPVEMAKKMEPAAPAAPRAAAPVPRRARVAAPAAAEPAAEQKLAERVEEKPAEAEAKPKLEVAARARADEPAPAPSAAPSQELAKGGVVGGVVGGVLAEQAAGLRYTILKRGPDGQYAEVDPDTVFERGDNIRLRVEANQNGHVQLLRQDAAGAWKMIAQIPVEPRAAQVVPAEGGLSLGGPEKLRLEFSRQVEGALATAGGKPRVQKAADQRAVYAVELGGGPGVRVEITLTVR